MNTCRYAISNASDAFQNYFSKRSNYPKFKTKKSGKLSFQVRGDRLTFFGKDNRYVRIPGCGRSKKVNAFDCKKHRIPFVVDVDYSFRPVDILGKRVGYWEGGYYRVSEKVGKPINYFICAPTNKMKSDRFTITIKRVRDPFICSYNQRVNSVFIHSRWGEESNSSIVKRYEKLNKLISERIVDLGLESYRSF